MPPAANVCGCQRFLMTHQESESEKGMEYEHKYQDGVHNR